MNFTITNSTRHLAQGLVAASTMAVLGAGIAAACHPQGVITKDVQNLTTGSAVAKADTTATAVTARPGDSLMYTITIENVATAQNDEMINTMITDTLPAGLSLVKADSYNVGTVSMKHSATRTVTVKVMATTAGLIKNTACFTGDSIDHKVPQKGCDIAYVNVVVPTPTPTPIPTPTPTPIPHPTPTPQVLGVQTLPATGSPIASTTIGLSAMIGTGMAYLRSRKQK